MWSYATGEMERELNGHSDVVLDLAVRGDRIASTSRDGTVRAWNATTGEELGTFRHGYKVFAVAFVSDNVIAAGDDFGRVLLWNLVTGEKMHTIQAHEKRVRDLVVSPDGRLILSGSYDGTAKTWGVP
ncbi:MAG: hypothetical protein AAGI46_03005 [Planctomycetota bacterium]